MRESLYYDGQQATFLKDYLTGNDRVEKALAFISRRLPRKTRNVLDVGCGIGWTTHEMSRLLPEAKLFDVDLSPRSIQTAQKLFSEGRIDYRVGS